ncbi:hypothetical protein [Tropicimonas sp. S265A]|uniref:hypothetical protein n=1 Tax=Tropicimonas sp. S265A TaxID=3415134 RepID=UPI003C7A7683
MPFEADLIPILCTLMLGGAPEHPVPYSVGYDLHHIRVDCVTEDTVIEVGLDRRSSLDSVQQALFAAHLTGKIPQVTLIDTDGREGPFEYRIRSAAKAANVDYAVYKLDFLTRWQMTHYLRNRPPPQPLTRKLAGG